MDILDGVLGEYGEKCALSFDTKLARIRLRDQNLFEFKHDFLVENRDHFLMCAFAIDLTRSGTYYLWDAF